MTRVKFPLLLSCLSLCLLTACGKKSAESTPTKDEAKTPSEAQATPNTPAATPQGGPPKGKDAPGNLEPVVEAAMGVSGCKFDEDNKYLDNECTALDALAKAIDDQGEPKLSAPTLVNLLGEQSDAVRWAAADSLARGGWQDNADLVATVIVALGTEKHTGVAQALADPLYHVEAKTMEAAQVIAAYEGALATQIDHERFAVLLYKLNDCDDTAACRKLYVHAAKQNPDLENRSFAAREVMGQGDLLGDSCSVVAEVAIALSQAKAADPEAEFQPHADAAERIDDLRGIRIDTDDGKTKDCAAELPKLLDAGISQAKAGTLHRDVFYSLLDIERREDKATYMAKLETLAKAVEGNAKLDEDLRGAAKEALEDWKAG